jgi:hypothetical protein
MVVIPPNAAGDVPRYGTNNAEMPIDTGGDANHL